MQRRRRKSIRIGNYNYCTAGHYFITICTWKKACLLGKVEKDCFRYSEIGRFVEKAICFINERYENIVLEAYTVMPNHVHLVINIRSPGGFVKPKEYYDMEPDKGNAVEPALVSIPDIIRISSRIRPPSFTKSINIHYGNGVISITLFDQKKNWMKLSNTYGTIRQNGARINSISNPALSEKHRKDIRRERASAPARATAKGLRSN